jgi:tetratricopeptide (TPR) repeat protein
MLLLLCASSALLFARTGQPPQPPECIKQGQRLIREGKPDQALALYRQILQTMPDSLPANIAAGNVLDLMGKGEEARKYFFTAIDPADTPELKAGVQRAIAMSYVFEGNCARGGVCVDRFRRSRIRPDMVQGRHDAGLKEPDIKLHAQTPWASGLEHAQARIAARQSEPERSAHPVHDQCMIGQTYEG